MKEFSDEVEESINNKLTHQRGKTEALSILNYELKTLQSAEIL